MPLDAAFYKRIEEARQRDRDWVATFDLPVEEGTLTYDAAWALRMLNITGEMPKLPAEFRERLINDALDFGEGKYSRPLLETYDDIDVLEAYTSAVAAFGQGQE